MVSVRVSPDELERLTALKGKPSTWLRQVVDETLNGMRTQRAREEATETAKGHRHRRGKEPTGEIFERGTPIKIYRCTECDKEMR